MERNKSGLNMVMEFSNTEQLRINGVKKHCLRKKIFFNLFSTKMWKWNVPHGAIFQFFFIKKR
jgi:hypothetical protein